MRGIFYASIVLLLAAGLGAAPAKADTDQHCLNLCINGGGNATTCLPQCSYNEPQQHSLSGTRALSPHDVFDAPRPAGDEILVPSHTAKAADRGKDYVCLNKCLHDGGQYDRCSKSCTRTDCPTGASNCNDVLGGTPVLPSAPSGTSSPAVH